ncbi:MAG TPA: hypothetical protein DD670_19845 [Planctomycetaceae bacterium]|nr:hypothetical protein [Planctomycetaceae bacterium]
MDTDCSERRTALNGRAIAGAVAALGITFLVLFAIGYILPLDPTLEALKRQRVGVRVLLVSPVAGAIIGTVVGHRQVSLYWLWWVLLFWGTCLIPVFPSKSGLLPLGTPYVNGPLCWMKAGFFVTHLGATALLAAVVHVFYRLGLRLWKRGDASATTVSQQDGG